MDLKTYLFPFGIKPKPEPDGPRYADLYERGAAAAVDVSILFLLLYDLFNYIWDRLRIGLIDHTIEPHVQTLGDLLRYMWEVGFPQVYGLNALIQLSIIGLFVVGSQFVWHTTPGKYLFGISIRRAGTLEEPADWRYVLRYIAYLVGAPTFFLISFNKQRRGLHDRIAGTVVIHTRPKGWYWDQVKRGFRKLFGKKDESTPPVE
jgi:uncharacterized RDD family membrane protein YckC